MENAVLYGFILLVLNETMRCMPALGYGFVLLIPALTVPRLARERGQQMGFYYWLKLATMIPCALLLLSVRILPLEASWSWLWPNLVVGLLCINILEALLTDLSNRNYANLPAGALLLLTLPSPATLRLDASMPMGDLLYETPTSWVMLYTLWNFAFICRHRPHSWLVYVPVLAASIIPCPLQMSLWLQSRTYTLVCHLILDPNLGCITSSLRWPLGALDDRQGPVALLQRLSLVFSLGYAAFALSSPQ